MAREAFSPGQPSQEMKEFVTAEYPEAEGDGKRIEDPGQLI